MCHVRNRTFSHIDSNDQGTFVEHLYLSRWKIQPRSTETIFLSNRPQVVVARKLRRLGKWPNNVFLPRRGNSKLGSYKLLSKERPSFSILFNLSWSPYGELKRGPHTRGLAIWKTDLLERVSAHKLGWKECLLLTPTHSHTHSLTMCPLTHTRNQLIIHWLLI